MGELFDPKSTSTMISDVSAICPFDHEWKRMVCKKWNQITEVDEIEELDLLFWKCNPPLGAITASEIYSTSNHFSSWI